MKKWFALLLSVCVLLVSSACAEATETAILLSDEAILVNGETISSDASQRVHLTLVTETHKDVPETLKAVENRVVTIASAGVYRISGTAQDVQIAVKAGEDDEVRLILDGVKLTCRTSSAIAIASAKDTREPGQYGVVIELADGTENFITGSHFAAEQEDGIEYDGAIGSQVSLGFEGAGSLTIDADNEGIEVAYGHLTINGGVFSISACDDPINVAEDGVGTLTVNDGYIYSTVKPLEGGEGDGVDSNGCIVFNGGTAINLAHPSSQDSGIDSDMGSFINGGIVVGAGNMYDPIESDSGQLFMMLEFGQETDSLVVVTDENDNPVFAYDFPYDYMYIAFSTPELTEGTYHVYLGGEIEGKETNGLYTDITAYTPGERMQHGGGNARQRVRMPAPDMGGEPPALPTGNAPAMPADMGGMDGRMEDVIAYQNALSALDLNELLKDTDLNVLLEGKDLNDLLSGFSVTDLLSEEQLAQYFGDIELQTIESDFAQGGFGGRGGMRGLESSADTATADFVLSRESTGFTNVIAESAE